MNIYISNNPIELPHLNYTLETVFTGILLECVGARKEFYHLLTTPQYQPYLVLIKTITGKHLLLLINPYEKYHIPRY